MNKTKIKCLGFLTSFALSIHASAALPRTLSLKTAPWSSIERIAQIDLSLNHASIAGIPKVPFGWTINLINDGNGSTKIIATAVDGLYFMNTSQLAGFLIIKPERGYTCLSLIRSSGITLSLRLYKTDSFRTVKLDSKQINFIE